MHGGATAYPSLTRVLATPCTTAALTRSASILPTSRLSRLHQRLSKQQNICTSRIPIQSRLRNGHRCACQSKLDTVHGSTDSSAEEILPAPMTSFATAGEDAADFQLQEQSLKSWSIFTVLLVGALAALYAVSIARVLSCVVLHNHFLSVTAHFIRQWLAMIRQPSRCCAGLDLS